MQKVEMQKVTASSQGRPSHRRVRGGIALAVATAAASLGSVGTAAFAATDNWQGGSATTPTWDQGANWSLGAKPSTADDAVFPTPVPATPGATIGLGTGETANSLTFNDAYTLGTAAGVGDLTLTTGNVTVASGKTASVASQLKGTAGLTLTGGGTLSLTNTTTATTNNTFSGGTNLNAGTLLFTVEAELGSATGNNITFNGGGLTYTNTGGSITLTGTRVLTIGAGGGTINLNGGAGTTGKINLGTANQLTGSGPLTKLGTADLQLGVAQNYSGVFTISGLIEASVSGSLGTSTDTITKSGELAVSTSATLPNNITFDNSVGPGAVNPIVSPIGGGAATLSGNLTASGAFTVALRDFNNTANGRNMTFSGPMTGSGALTTAAATTGNMTLLLNGANSGYSGAISVAAGTGVSFGTANSKGTGTLTVASSTTALGGVGVGFVPAAQSNLPAIDTNSTGTNGGVFEINTIGFTTALDLNTLYGSAASPTGGSAGKWFLGSATTGTYTAATIGASSDGNYRLGGGGGTLTVSTAALADPSGGGSNNLVVGSTSINGGGTVVLSANNPFTGTVTINGGVLSVGTVASGGAASPLGAGASAIVVGATTASTGGAATFRYTGATASTDRGLTMGTSGGTVDVTTAAATLTVGPVTGGPLTKISSGALTVTNPSPATLASVTLTAGNLNLGAGGTTVSGTTTVTAGTLAFGAGANTLTGATAVNGGTFNLGSGTNTVNGAMNVNTGTLNANGASAFNAAVTVAVNGAGTLAAPSGAAVTIGTTATPVAVTVGSTTGTSTATTTGTLNLSSAASFTANITAFNIGNIASTAGTGDTIGTVTLPPSATITATSVLIGDTPNPSNSTRTSTLTFGSGSSTLQTPTLTVGGRKSKGLLNIASGGTLTINNGLVSGVPQPTALLVSNQDPGSGTTAFGDVTLTGGTLLGTFGTIVVGDKTTTANTGTGSATGTFTLGASSANNVTATGIILARKAATTTGTLFGTFTTGGGTVTVGSGGITDGTGTSTLALTGAGVLNMQGNNIGSIANPIDTLTYTNGTLRNLGTLGQALVQNGATTLLDVLSNNATITGNYTLTAGTAQAAAGRTLSVTGAASVGSTGVYATALSNPGTPTAGVMAVTGALDLTAAGDKLNLLPQQAITTATTFTIATFASETGVFDSVLANGVATQNADPNAANYVLVTYNPTNIQVTANNLSAVPEPGSIALVGIGAAGLLARRRRRR